MQKKIKQAETCSGLGGEGYFTAGSHRHIPTIAYAWFLCPPHPLSLHSSLSRALQGSVFPRFQDQGWALCTSAFFEQSPDKWSSSLTSSKPLGKRQEAPSHLLQSSFSGAGQWGIPAAAFLLPATSLPLSLRHRQGRKAAVPSSSSDCTARVGGGSNGSASRCFSHQCSGALAVTWLVSQEKGAAIPESPFCEQKD